MHSRLYEGAVAHRRRRPVSHRFRGSLVMAYLDLDEIDRLVGPGRLLPTRRIAPWSYARKDRLFSPDKPLVDEARDLIERHSGERPCGPIRLLTQMRSWGYYFSPLNLYYAFDAAGERVSQVLAEVNNTPWGERHVYVLSDNNRTSSDSLRFAHPKSFHVSPFMGMDAEYRWRLNEPGEKLLVTLGHEREDGLLFDATLVLHERPLTRASLRRAAIRYPWLTAQVVTLIYYQALRLWQKRCPYYPHPRNLDPAPAKARQPLAADPNP
ncbi:hypothetical protein Mal64_32210 [Pseudobythopirellula maris]|uniref:DUF1365 domain-containing protein n=1 Tax=Pseudobythopirellula maris TaxID=2527991 RepID=A0A5C5ZJW6_9BACT|nr:DUF1365 domain-containing protein [Pseudobythopirellula maris]TWT87679.1 hypothetical protein Mal64_32210 [Pseudobythopirellula maris]